MKKNLADFASENREEKTVNEKFIKNRVDEYSKLSQSELKNKLFQEVNHLKSNGNFDFEKISSITNSVNEYLTKEQQENLKRLLEQIR